MSYKVTFVPVGTTKRWQVICPQCGRTIRKGKFVLAIAHEDKLLGVIPEEKIWHCGIYIRAMLTIPDKDRLEIFVSTLRSGLDPKRLNELDVIETDELDPKAVEVIQTGITRMRASEKEIQTSQKTTP